MDGRRESFVIEHLYSDMLCLQASVQVEAAPLAVDYDSRTLRYLGAASTDEAASRTQMMVTLLRLLDRADAMPVIEQALASPHFYTRWHVMREMLALDADAALPSLRRMARQDPHPEVRFAATQALSLFFNEEAEELVQCRA
jgi:HEAT repeat protein